MDDPNFRKVISVILLVSLVLLSIFILKSIIISIIISFLLAFIFAPIYDKINKKLKSPNISASIILVVLLIIIIVPLWFLTPILIKQSFNIFQLINQADITNFLGSIAPNIFGSGQFATEISSILSSFTSNAANSLTNYLASIVLEFPKIMLHLLIIFFTFFFVLRDKEIIINYIKGLIPFSKEIEDKIFAYSKGVTASILYGQFIVGIIQGAILGLGLFIFRIPNALFLTMIAVILGIIPIIGPAVLWVPLAIYLFVTNNDIAAWGIVAFGSIASTIDNFLRPMIVERRTKIHSAIVLISMIGGFFFFGIMGFILGPLVISYLLILLEAYRGKAKPLAIIQEPASK